MINKRTRQLENKFLFECLERLAHLEYMFKGMRLNTDGLKEAKMELKAKLDKNISEL